MFEIGFPELLVIVFVGLLVIGPEKLPQIIKALTRSFRALGLTLMRPNQK